MIIITLTTFPMIRIGKVLQNHAIETSDYARSISERIRTNTIYTPSALLVPTWRIYFTGEHIVSDPKGSKLK